MELRELERVARNAALGVRFWDVATDTLAIDGLKVEVFHRANPRARTVAKPGPSGIYVAHNLPGLRDFEFQDVELAQDLWPAATRPYRIEVSDPEGRYLPIAFDADLPARGPFTWLAPWFSPPQAIEFPGAPGSPGSPGSPPQLMLERVPLFSAPSRPPPEPLAVVHAQMIEQGSARELAWGLLGVAIDGVSRGIGLADGRGRVVVLFPYPEPPRISLSSPILAHNDFTWEVELTAFGAPASPATPPAPFADLAQILESVAVPRDVVESVVSPPLPLRLTYRQALVARTAGTADADASFLFVS
jgi:hypothetical protein